MQPGLHVWEVKQLIQFYKNLSSAYLEKGAKKYLDVSQTTMNKIVWSDKTKIENVLVGCNL